MLPGNGCILINLLRILVDMNNCNNDAAAPRTDECTLRWHSVKRNNVSGIFTLTISITSFGLDLINNQPNLIADVHVCDSTLGYCSSHSGIGVKPCCKATFVCAFDAPMLPNSILLLLFLEPTLVACNMEDVKPPVLGP